MHIQVHTHVYMFKKKNFNINAYRSYRFSISECVVKHVVVLKTIH